MKENDDELLRKRFSEEEAPISPRVWANIKKTLPEEKGPKPWFRDSRIITTLAGLVLLGSVASGYFISTTNIFFTNKHSLDTLRSDTQIGIVEEQNNLRIGQKAAKDSMTNSNFPAIESTLPVSQKLSNSSSTSSDISEPYKRNKVKEQKNGNAKTIEQKENVNDTFLEVKKVDVTRPSIDNLVSVNNGEALSKKSLVKKNKKSELTNTELEKTIGLSSKTEKAILENISTNAISKGNKSDINPKVPAGNLSSDLNTTNAGNLKINDVSINKINGQNKSIKVEEAINTPGIENRIINPNKELERNSFVNNTNSQKLMDEGDEKNIETKSTFDDNGPIVNPSSTFENTKSAIINNPTDTVPSATDNSFTVLVSTVNVKDTLNVKEIDSTGVNNKDSVVAATDSVKKDKKQKLGSRFSLDLVLAPMLTGASSNTSDNSIKPLVESKNGQDKNQFGYSFGGMVNYTVLPRILLSSGLIYSSSGEKYSFKNNVPYDTTYTNSYTQTDSVLVQDTSGNYYLYSDTTITTFITDTLSKFYENSKRDSYTFLSIPFTISYSLIQNKRVNIMLTGGVKANILLSGSTYVMNSAGTDLEMVSAGFKKITFSYLASIGFEYRLTEKMGILVQPIANYHMSSVHVKSYTLTQKPYSFGVNVGLRFKF